MNFEVSEWFERPSFICPLSDLKRCVNINVVRRRTSFVDITECPTFHSSIILDQFSFLKVVTYPCYCSGLLLCLSSVLRYCWLVLHWDLLHRGWFFKLSIFSGRKGTTFDFTNYIRGFFPNWIVLISSLWLFADDASFNYLCSISKLSMRYSLTCWVSGLIITSFVYQILKYRCKCWSFLARMTRCWWNKIVRVDIFFGDLNVKVILFRQQPLQSPLFSIFDHLFLNDSNRHDLNVLINHFYRTIKIFDRQIS